MRDDEYRWSWRLKEAMQHLYWDVIEEKDIKRQLDEIFTIVLKQRLPNDIESIRSISDSNKS